MPIIRTYAIALNEAQSRRVDEMIARYNETRNPETHDPITSVEQLIAGGLVCFELLIMGISDPDHVSCFEEADHTPKVLR